jgi:hypothetical protein
LPDSGTDVRVSPLVADRYRVTFIRRVRRP